MLLLSLDCSTLPLICTLYCWVLSKEVSSTIFEVFGMTRPGIEPRSPGPLANTLLTRPMSRVRPNTRFRLRLLCLMACQPLWAIVLECKFGHTPPVAWSSDSSLCWLSRQIETKCICPRRSTKEEKAKIKSSINVYREGKVHCQIFRSLYMFWSSQPICMSVCLFSILWPSISSPTIL